MRVFINGISECDKVGINLTQQKIHDYVMTFSAVLYSHMQMHAKS